MRRLVRRASRLLALLIVVAACSGKSSPPPPPPAVAADHWTCAADADCVNSCGWGAVNRSWYQDEAAKNQDCKDGCADRAKARCVERSCVAFRHNGERDDTCTQVPAP